MPFPPPSEKQARVIWHAITGLAMAVMAGLVVALIWGLGKVLNLLAPVLWPIAVAGVLAYLLDPLVDWLERTGVSRARAIMGVFALALLLIAVWFGSVLPQVINETGQLAQKIPEYADEVDGRIEEWVRHPPALVRRFLGDRLGLTNTLDINTNVAPATLATNAVPPVVARNPVSFWAELLGGDALEPTAGSVGKALRQAGWWLGGQVKRVPSWFGVLVGLVLIPLYAFYFLLEKKGIESKWTEYLPVARSSFKDELVFVLQAINGYLIVFFRGQVLVAMCDGILYTIGFLIIGLPYAVLLGVMATVLIIIPFIGAIITVVLALIIALVQFGDWQHPLLVLAVAAVVQSLDGLVISPRIMGNRVGLHPITIIIAVMIGITLLGGLLGGILAIPVTAALRVILSRYVWKKREA